MVIVVSPAYFPSMSVNWDSSRMEDEVFVKTHFSYLNRSVPTGHASGAVDSGKQKEKINMNAVSLENSKPHLQRSRWRESSRRVLRSCSGYCLILFALVTLASTSRAASILGVTDCNSTNLTIQLSQFPQVPLVVTFGGVPVDGTYDYANQTIVVTRPPGMPPGTYLLTVWHDGQQSGQQSSAQLASTNVVLCAIAPCECPPGPTGPAGTVGATGPQGPQGIKGDTGATGQVGPMGLTGATGPAGPAGTNQLSGTNGIAGPAGPKGDTGAVGPAGSIGATGPAGLNGTNGIAGPAGPKGDTGAVGPVGPTGATGATGLTGSVGPIGPVGATGASGPAGTNGVNGTGGSGSSQYGYIYNLAPRTVAIDAVVLFDSNGVLTPGITHTPGSSDIKIVSAGDYKVTFSVSGTEPGQFALFLNGIQVPGTVYGSGAGTQQDNGQCIIAIGANDVLTLRNRSSTAAVGLQSLAGGTQINVNASIVVQKLN